METVVWIGFSLSVFAAIMIATKRERSISDIILSAWLFLLSISFLFSGIDYQVFNHPLLTNAFLLINPAFYLYIKSLTTRSYKLKWIQLLHLLPFILFEVVVIILKVPLSYKSIIINTDGALLSEAFIAITILSWIIYNVSSIVLVHRHRKNLKNEFSSIERNVKIGWILFIIIFYSSFCIIVFGIGVYSFFTESYLIITHSVTYSGFLVLVYILGYYGLKQRKIFQETSNSNLTDKYENSFLTLEKKREIKSVILSYFEKEQPFLNSDLNMDLLAVQIKIPKHQISEVLSTEIGKNFFQFVNYYRVESVKKNLKDESNLYSIEAIGYDCGFNSKSSFFTVFKKSTGKTPLQYKNSIIHNPE